MYDKLDKQPRGSISRSYVLLISLVAGAVSLLCLGLMMKDARGRGRLESTPSLLLDGTDFVVMGRDEHNLIMSCLAHSIDCKRWVGRGQRANGSPSTPGLAHLLPILRDAGTKTPAFIEVGAGCGSNSILAASLGYDVASIEAHPSQASLASFTASLNSYGGYNAAMYVGKEIPHREEGKGRVTVFNVALIPDSPLTHTGLHVPDDGKDPTLGGGVGRGGTDIQVPAASLDLIHQEFDRLRGIHDDPIVLMLDASGSEYWVMRAGQGLLGSGRVGAIIMGYTPRDAAHVGVTRAMMLDLFTSLERLGFDALDGLGSRSRVVHPDDYDGYLGDAEGSPHLKHYLLFVPQSSIPDGAPMY